MAGGIDKSIPQKYWPLSVHLFQRKFFIAQCFVCIKTYYKKVYILKITESLNTNNVSTLFASKFALLANNALFVEGMLLMYFSRSGKLVIFYYDNVNKAPKKMPIHKWKQRPPFKIQLKYFLKPKRPEEFWIVLHLVLLFTTII